MKVLMINSVAGIRSTGRICTDLAEVLESEGHECKIAYGRESVPEKYSRFAVRIGTPFGTKLHGLKSRLFDASGFGSRRATKRFIKWVKEYNPDIIHLHNLHGYYINIKILFDYLKTSGKKVVWTLHDCWAFTGHCAHFVTSGCERWRTECFNCPKKRAYPSSLVDKSKRNYSFKKNLFTGLDNLTVVTPSRWLEGLVKESFLGEYRTQVINNGIDLSVFKPTESDFKEKNGISDKKIVLGVASAWGKNKGLDDFKSLSGILSDEYKIVLVGLTEEQIAQMPEKILSIKRTNSTRELAEIYTAADVFVNPTYSDTYPTVNLEAQACGTPVITYRTGGSVESACDNGIVEQGDIEGIKRKICSETIRCREDLDLSLGKMIEQYLDIYKNT